LSVKNSYSNIFKLFITKIKLFIIIGIVAVIASVVVSSPFFIPPKYKSEAVIYPSNLGHYSTETFTEQLLQLFQGNDIRDSIISKYDLINHYEIDTSSNSYLYHIHKEYNSNVSIKKTKLESVHIEVIDIDPVIARDIAQELIIQVNNKIRRLQQEHAMEVVVINKNQLDNKKELIDTLEAQIKRYSIEYGLLDYMQQSREVTAGYMNMLLENKKGESMKKAEKLYENLKVEGRYFHDLHHQLNLAREEFNKILISYDAANKDFNKKMTYTKTMVYPEVPDKKSYPIRWIIVASSLFVSILFTYIILLFNNRFKNI
jgi:capsule polysaccharide export protein KpsE/RkpR